VVRILRRFRSRDILIRAHLFYMYENSSAHSCIIKFSIETTKPCAGGAWTLILCTDARALFCGRYLDLSTNVLRDIMDFIDHYQQQAPSAHKIMCMNARE
jgi:hypothetical protein